jgi:hypothetical protein
VAFLQVALRKLQHRYGPLVGLIGAEQLKAVAVGRLDILSASLRTHSLRRSQLVPATAGGFSVFGRTNPNDQTS